MQDEAAALESAVDRALDGGLRTRDLGGDGDHGAGHRTPSSTTCKERKTWSRRTSSG